MDIVQVATVLSDTVFATSTKRNITVTPTRIDVKGVLDSTGKKGTVTITSSGEPTGMIGMSVRTRKNGPWITARKHSEEMNAAEVKNFGTAALDAIRKTLATA